MFHAQQKAYGNRVRRMTPNWFDVWTRMIRVRSITPELHQAAMTALSDKGFEDAVAVQPPGRVEIQVESSDAGAASVSTATLTFTQSNWSTAQRVTVTGGTTMWSRVATAMPPSATGPPQLIPSQYSRLHCHSGG